MIASIELQKAIYKELTNKAPYTVFDTAPLNQSFPYIIIGNTTRVPNLTKDLNGYTMSVMFHCYSNKNSSKEVKEMSHVVETTLIQDFDIDGFYNTKQDLTLETSQDEDLNGEVVHHYILEMEFILTEKGEY